MMAIFGLGNPGWEYERTRHNLGFMVVDKLAEKLNVNFKPGKGEYILAETKFKDKEIIIVKPLTYMNNSGTAVKDVVERYGVDLKNILVVCDDFNLPLGVIRIRPGGSDGGHKGLRSVIYHLESENFPRLRCGIGTSERIENAVEFVLSNFTEDEFKIVSQMVDTAVDAILCFVSDGIQTAMNRFNKKVKQNLKTNRNG